MEIEYTITRALGINPNEPKGGIQIFSPPSQRTTNWAYSHSTLPVTNLGLRFRNVQKAWEMFPAISSLIQKEERGRRTSEIRTSDYLKNWKKVAKMEIVRSQRKAHGATATAANDVVPTLPLYRSAPALEVRLEDFELFAIDRLRG